MDVIHPQQYIILFLFHCQTALQYNIQLGILFHLEVVDSVQLIVNNLEVVDMKVIHLEVVHLAVDHLKVDCLEVDDCIDLV